MLMSLVRFLNAKAEKKKKNKENERMKEKKNVLFYLKNKEIKSIVHRKQFS